MFDKGIPVVMRKLERELFTLRLQLKNKNPSPARTYPPFNPDSENDRFAFLAGRDGFEFALAQVKQLKKIYLASSLATRKNTRSRNHPFRHKYLEAAYALRNLLRRSA